jgi:hypothetical protein
LAAVLLPHIGAVGQNRPDAVYLMLEHIALAQMSEAAPLLLLLLLLSAVARAAVAAAPSTLPPDRCLIKPAATAQLSICCSNSAAHAPPMPYWPLLNVQWLCVSTETAVWIKLATLQSGMLRTGCLAAAMR